MTVPDPPPMAPRGIIPPELEEELRAAFELIRAEPGAAKSLKRRSVERRDHWTRRANRDAFLIFEHERRLLAGRLHRERRRNDRYRDLVLITKLIWLEYELLAGRVGPGRRLGSLPSGPITPGQDLPAQWARPWGVGPMSELSRSFSQFMAERDRLGHRLSPPVLAGATAEAELELERIVAPTALEGVTGKAAKEVKADAEASAPELPPEPAPPSAAPPPPQPERRAQAESGERKAREETASKGAREQAEHKQAREAARRSKAREQAQKEERRQKEKLALQRREARRERRAARSRRRREQPRRVRSGIDTRARRAKESVGIGIAVGAGSVRKAGKAVVSIGSAKRKPDLLFAGVAAMAVALVLAGVLIGNDLISSGASAPIVSVRDAREASADASAIDRRRVALLERIEARRHARQLARKRARERARQEALAEARRQARIEARRRQARLARRQARLAEKNSADALATTPDPVTPPASTTSTPSKPTPTHNTPKPPSTAQPAPAPAPTPAPAPAGGG